MFSRKKVPFSSDFDTLIGIKTIFEGNIKSEGSVRIDGKVKGDIDAGGDVFIGNSASVHGNIIAGNIHLAGNVDGNVDARGMLKLMSTARLYGDVQVNSFVADEGGVFQGKCIMHESSNHVDAAIEAPSKKVFEENELA